MKTERSWKRWSQPRSDEIRADGPRMLTGYPADTILGCEVRSDVGHHASASSTATVVGGLPQIQ